MHLGCSRLGVSGLTAASGLYVQSNISLFINANGACGTTPVYVQTGSNASRAVIISNRNLAFNADDPVFWVVLDDASRLVGLSIADVALAVFSGGSVPGMLAALVDGSASRTAFSTQGPVRLTDASGNVTVECGLFQLCSGFHIVMFCSLPAWLSQQSWLHSE
jgi:hypothetical protein